MPLHTIDIRLHTYQTVVSLAHANIRIGDELFVRATDDFWDIWMLPNTVFLTLIRPFFCKNILQNL